ncbi:MAG TPA: hypothetical protein PLH43_09450 [Acetivibrio sp.]|uniref:hypothetical protein n=1 Tax=Acetivibrio sp. TaxID=1872092 RepID=UPI002D008B8F|nr:hypothetical protein [Acetivibrio sp.]HOM03038.1 hypothetical protein [Acetivibrio sp.]
MAQYDIILNQNIASSGAEFVERLITADKGCLITFNSSKVPVMLPPGGDGCTLISDSTSAYGIRWTTAAVMHEQNTDTGTTSSIFKIDSDGNGIELTAETNERFAIKQNGGDYYADLRIRDIFLDNINLAGSSYRNTVIGDGKGKSILSIYPTDVKTYFTISGLSGPQVQVDFYNSIVNIFGPLRVTSVTYFDDRVVIGSLSPPSSSVALEIASKKAFLAPRLTTSERLALSPIEGMIVYDTTLKLFYGYQNGQWYYFQRST